MEQLQEAPKMSLCMCVFSVLNVVAMAYGILQRGCWELGLVEVLFCHW